MTLKVNIDIQAGKKIPPFMEEVFQSSELEYHQEEVTEAMRDLIMGNVTDPRFKSLTETPGLKLNKDNILDIKISESEWLGVVQINAFWNGVEIPLRFLAGYPRRKEYMNCPFGDDIADSIYDQTELGKNLFVITNLL